MEHVVRARAGNGRALRRALAVIVSAFTLAAGLVAVSAPVPAQAISASEFKAGDIISDANFYDGNAMTEAQIQSFLNGKIGTCANSYCLNVYKQTTVSRAKDRTVCNAYEGAANEPAARIIFKVQQACSISAKVILVTLQKEQGLVTSKGPSSGTLGRAMGYACPDHTGGTCDSTFYGFFNQVYWGAWQMKRYSTPDIFGGFWAGQSRNILYSPNPGCGSKWVTIKNRATAALYNYTPYTPTAAALAAYPHAATGSDAYCGSYGNRNFWFFYYSWFGSPTDIHPTDVAVDRVGGSDRFDTAVLVSKSAFPGNAPVVYVTSGMDFPDALSAAPAAASALGPLLLVQPTVLPPAVKAEIQRLAPEEIVVVGGEGAVSKKVYDELSTLAPGIRRDGGIDRFATSRAIAEAGFPDGAESAFIATGAAFPDALSAGAAAGSLGAPVVLVKGTDPTIDQATIDLLTALGVKNIYITGGTAVVSSGLESSLATVPGVEKVVRYGGANRYIVSGATNRATFDTSERVYLASGLSFPDALAGAAVAGMNKQPLYLTPPACVYTFALEDLQNFGATTMTLLGGTGALGAGVANFTNCH
jgi:putative cell wall-binding protein